MAARMSRTTIISRHGSASSLAGAPAVPGLTFRPFDDADYEAVVAVTHAENEADDVDWRPTAGDFRAEWEHKAHFDVHRDVVVAEIDGEVIAWGELSWDLLDEVATFFVSGAVHPRHRRRGIGRAILRENERRARERAPIEVEGGRNVVFGAWTPDSQVGSQALLRAEGFEPVRFFFEMGRVDLGSLPAAPLPAGLEIRPVTRENLRQVFAAANEAFRDHWGHREQTDTDFEATLAIPDLDLSLWRVAWDDDQVAGVVSNYIWRTENELLGIRRGWLEQVSVRRPWRRRGLARALIVESLRALREAGMDEGMLGVDAANPTGALGLYQGVGFTVRKRASSFRKPF
jgi:mycothiol synthase